MSSSFRLQNKEKLHEHINKIISQNEAIVENKELLLQKKYPKTLNRSRSFTNANSTSSTGSSNSSQTLQTTTGAPPSESATNAKLAQVIVQKQQQQLQQQQQQQQYLYQQHQQVLENDQFYNVFFFDYHWTKL